MTDIRCPFLRSDHRASRRLTFVPLTHESRIMPSLSQQAVVVRRTLFVLLLVIIPVASADGASRETFAAPHRSIERFVGSETVLVAWVDVSQMDLEGLRDFAASAGLTPLPEIPPQVREIRSALLELGVTRVYWVSSLADLLSGPGAVLVPADEEQIDKVTLLLEAATGSGQTVVADGDVVLAGRDSAVASLQATRDRGSQNLLTALERSHSPNGIVLGMSTEPLKTAAGVLADQAAQLGPLSEPAVRLLPELQSIALHGQLPPTRMSLELQTAAPDSAAQLAALLNLQISSAAPAAAKALHLTVRDATVSLRKDSLDESMEAVRMVLSLLRPARDAADRQTVMNQLKQHALAMHNFYDVHGRFPPQRLAAADGQPLLSWRVLILPYLGHKDLYDQFRLDEPWDSPHNLQLVDQMPADFRSPDDAETLTAAGKTRFVGPLTEHSLFGRPGESVRFQDIIDGTSNTLMVVQTTAAQAVVWTQPTDLRVSEDHPVLQQIAGPADGFAACGCDGAAHYLSGQADEETLRALLSIDGGELTQWP